MIEDILTHAEGATLRAPVCVVGTGPAGAEAIRTFRRHGVPVIVAEGGRHEFDKITQALTLSDVVGRPVRVPDPESELTPYLDPKFRGEGRLRQFGGNSNIWTGKWREFEPLDFRVRAHVPDSGWPLAHADLVPLYREVEADYGFGDLGTAPREKGFGAFLDRVADSDIETGFHHWEDTPLRVPDRFGADFAADEDLRVILGAHAVELIQSRDSDTVACLRCRSLEGREIRIEADAFVLAMGGIETPRLLLASDGKHAGGVGNENGLVGRYFQDHPKVKAGVFWPGPAFALLPDGAADFPRPRLKPAFSLAEAVQDRLGILNHTVQFSPLPDAPRARIAKLAGQRSYGAVLREVGRALRLPLDDSPYRVALIFEQAPNADSRITLSDERDAVGLRKSVIDWRLVDLDHHTFATVLDRLPAELARAGIGRIDFGARRPTLADTVDCRHHIGTTRMAPSADTGVVDADGRMFGAPNVYLAGSAVFPTGNSYGPTLTIVTLARRTARAILRDRGVLETAAA